MPLAQWRPCSSRRSEGLDDAAPAWGLREHLGIALGLGQRGGALLWEMGPSALPRARGGLQEDVSRARVFREDEGREPDGPVGMICSCSSLSKDRGSA